MWAARLRSPLRGVASRAAVERDLDDELRLHLDARADDLVARRRLSPDEARRIARLEFGSVERYKEESREARGLRLVDTLRGDLRYSVRQLPRDVHAPVDGGVSADGAVPIQGAAVDP